MSTVQTALPVAWPQAWGARHPRRPLAMLGIGSALLLIAVVMAATAPGDAARGWSALVFALFAFTALAVYARAPFGHGTPQMINAVTLTRARVAPPDSWVHFARERRTGVMLLIVFAVWGLVFAATTVAAVIIGVTGRPQALVGAVVTAVVAIAFLYGAVRGVIAQYRLDSFGRRPVGISFGPSGVAVLRVSDPVYIPWDAIRSVQADVTTPRRGDPMPLLRIHADPRRVRTADGDEVPGTITLSPGDVRLHPHVLWTALRVFRDAPDERAKLGTTFGQQMLEEWCAAA